MNRRTLYAFFISFGLLIVIIILNRVSFNRMQEYAHSVDHTRNVITSFERLANHFKSAQIYTPANDSIPTRQFNQVYKNEASTIGTEINHLRLLTKDNPEQVALIDSLSSMISGQIYTLMNKSLPEIIRSGESWRLPYLLSIDEIIKRGVARERDLLAYRNNKLKESTRINNILTLIFAFIAIAIIASIFLSAFFLSRKRIWLEEFLESILNTSQNGIIYFKAIRDQGKIVDFRMEYANKAIEKLLEVKLKDAMGSQVRHYPVGLLDPDLFRKYTATIESGEPTIFENLYHRDGVEKWFLVSLTKMEDGITASFQDITQLKKYEEELKSNITQLERSNRELEQYAYVASHDLQEPLRKIRSFGSYLDETQGKNLDEKGRMHLGKIMSAAERMSILIKDVLSFSSMRREDLFAETDLNLILRNVLTDLDLSISQKGAQIQSERLPTIEAIPLQMTQLFYNLISNSLKFAGSHQRPEINITSSTVSEGKKQELGLSGEGSYMEMVFSDNGIGFSQDYAEQIFGLFKRLNNRQNYPGSGIGLALCRKVVDNHNGLLFAKARENAGASFYIYLPERQKAKNL
ncbi:MAG: ATP-binding protein [Flavisolibacter sp.]